MKFVDYVIDELVHRRYSTGIDIKSVYSDDFERWNEKAWLLYSGPNKWYHFFGGKSLVLKRYSGPKSLVIKLSRNDKKRLTVAYKAAIRANKEIARQRKEAAQYL